MFAMRFTPNSHIAMVGNSNDVRGDSYYSSDGNWQEPYGNTAEVTTHEVKVDGMLRDEDKKWKLSDQLSLKAQKRDYLSKTSTTMFLGDDVYSRYLFNNTNKKHQAGLQRRQQLHAIQAIHPRLYAQGQLLPLRQQLHKHIGRLQPPAD